MGRGLLHLPDELLLALLARLSPPSLCAARACDRRLRGLASDPALWRAALLQRWRRPEVCSPPTCGWMKEYSRRHKQDGRVPGLLRELHAAARCSSQTDRRDRLWRELLAAGLEIYDVASELVENGGADERDEAENLLRAINQGVVGREWHALIRKAEREETKADVSRPADATRMPVVWSGSQADGRPDCPEVGLQGSNTSHNSSSSSLPDLGLDALRRAFPCAEPPIRVEDGALLLVRWYATGPGLREPEMVADRCREGLDMLAVRLSRRLPRPFEPKDAVRALSHLLFTEDGYKGNEVNYYSPSNSLLDHVLESRTGIPISLSVLFAAVCRRVGVHLDMIGMPGHFLLATQPTASEPRTFVDVFHGGKLLGLADCEAIVRSYGIRWSESMVTPVPMSEVWSRMIRNLLNASRRSGDFENARLLERLLLREAEAHASSQTSGSGRVVGALASARSETVRPSTGSTDAAPCEENALYLPYPGSSPDEDESAGGAGSEQMMLMSLEQMQALLQMLAGNGQLHATGGGNGAGANGPS